MLLLETQDWVEYQSGEYFRKRKKIAWGKLFSFPVPVYSAYQGNIHMEYTIILLENGFSLELMLPGVKIICRSVEFCRFTFSTLPNSS